MKCRTWMIVYACITSLSLSPEPGFAAPASPADTIADVLPLHVGTGWKYQFYWHHFDYNMELMGGSIWRTGTVTYSIIDSLQTTDSTVWSFEERRHLKDSIRSFPGNSYRLTYDSTIQQFQLIELHTGGHQVYRPSPASPSPFEFTSDYVDTTPMLRYRSVDSTMTMTFLTRNHPPWRLSASYYYTMMANVGIVHAWGNYNDLSGLAIYVDYDYLFLESVVTDVREPVARKIPSSYVLRQNHPNPFNPTTRISYAIPENGIVKLVVYDVLGRTVTTLVNEAESEGIHDAVFDASGMPSGVYFYKLEAVSAANPERSYMQVKKMAVVK